MGYPVSLISGKIFLTSFLWIYGPSLNIMFVKGDLPCPGPVKGDVNGDGEINIADVNVLIGLILSGSVSDTADVNGDGEVNISDINTVIDIILNM